MTLSVEKTSDNRLVLCFPYLSTELILLCDTLMVMNVLMQTKKDLREGHGGHLGKEDSGIVIF